MDGGAELHSFRAQLGKSLTSAELLTGGGGGVGAAGGLFGEQVVGRCRRERGGRNIHLFLPFSR